MRRRYLCIICTALIISFVVYSSCALLFKPPKAAASAYVIGSDPVDGSTVVSVPQDVHIYFNAAISTLSSAHVFVTQNGALVEVRANTGVISGSNELIIPLKTPTLQELPQGSYLVRWVAVANDDGRTTFGTIGFNVGFPSTGLSGTPILGPSTSNALDEIRALDAGHATNILAVVWEWVMIVALTLLIGTLVMEQFVLSDGGRCTELHVHTKKRANSLQLFCLSALFFSEIVSLVLHTTALVENTHANSSYLSTLLSLLINTNYGRFWLARLALVLIAMGLLYWTKRSGGRPQGDAPTTEIHTSKGKLLDISLHVPTASTRFRTGPVGTAACACPVSAETPSSPGITIENRYPIARLLLSGLILLTVVLSRAPAQTFQPHTSAILFDWLNLAALGIWFGSFVYLGYLILPLFNNKELEYHTETLATVLQRLTPLILAAIGIQIVSTLFLSEAAINQPQQLMSDPYGRTLLLQIILLAVMLALSLYALLWLQSILKHQLLFLPLVHVDLPVRRLRQSELHRTKKSLGVMSISITWLGVGILLCMALMTFFTPPIHFPPIASSNQAPGSASTTNAQTKQIGNLSVSFQLLPGRSNEVNTIILLINDKNGNSVTDAQVRLSLNMQAMDMGTQSRLLSEGNPAYIASFDKGTTFNMAGLWVITVEIQQPDQDAVQGTFYAMLP